LDWVCGPSWPGDAEEHERVRALHDGGKTDTGTIGESRDISRATLYHRSPMSDSGVAALDADRFEPLTFLKRSARKETSMQPTPMTVSHEAPLHFWVRDIAPNPLSTSLLDQLILSIAYADKPGTIYFSTSVDVLAPYREPLHEAITEQAVFWVNWHYPDSQLWPAKPHDSTLDRLLEAIRNQQVVAESNGT
jgi:hypothetical protein